MESPNFSKEARSQAIELSKHEALRPFIDAARAEVEQQAAAGVLDKMAARNKFKPLFYAAIAHLMDEVVDYDAPPLPADDPRVAKTIADFDRSPDEIELLNLFLLQKHIAIIMSLIETDYRSAAVENLDLMQQLNSRLGHEGWSEPFLALNGGLGTMINFETLCFRSYLPAVRAHTTDPTEQKRILLRSSRDLTNLAMTNSVQLLGITETFSDETTAPAAIYDTSRDLMRFETPLDQTTLTPEVTAKIKQLEPDLDFEGVTKIDQLHKGMVIIGCPVTFRPRQIQELWRQAVEQAETLGMF